VIKRPAAISFLIAAAIALGLAGYMLANARTVDEKPFILFYSLVAFPFAWFLAWAILSVIAWWQGLIEGAERESTPGTKE
jgi:hypothetical protein